jgi:UDPglucose 6-dehydrogenase
MHAREIQAKNLALFLVQEATKTNLPIVIHGKAYKPDVPYCIGSYSTLVGYYVEQEGHAVAYVDPLAVDTSKVIACVDTPAVFLWAHNRCVTYEYTGDQEATKPYCEIKPGSVIIDPWRQLPLDMANINVVHYGNTRNQRV